MTESGLPVGLYGAPTHRIAVAFDVSLQHLATTGDDVSAVILFVRAAIAGYVCGAEDSLTIDGITSTVAGCTGVVRCRAATIDGLADDVSGSTFYSASQFIDCADVRIVPT